MSDTQVQEAASPPGELALDPFAFIPGVASRVKGLGGNTPSTDPYYVFHTPYVEVAEGMANFTVHFHGLTAKQGTLLLRVHMLPSEPGAHARMANSERIVFNRLVQYGGLISISFEGFRGVTYAVLGMVMGATDAAAESLTVTLDRPVDPNDQRRFAAEAKSSDYGRDTAEPTSFLISVDPPTLASPVSQVGTAAQLREKAAAPWLRLLRDEPPSDPARWQAVYTLEALRRYGMLEAGARGLGLGVADGPLPAILASHDVSVLVAPPSETMVEGEAAFLDGLRRPHLGDARRFEQNVTAQSALLTPLPPEFVNFDFLWSTDAIGQLGSVRAGLAFIEDAMACLRPRGLAVHSFPYDLTQREPGGDDSVAQRRHVERIALILVSRGHEVAQMKIDTKGALIDRAEDSSAPAREIARFCLIVRKAASAY